MRYELFTTVDITSTGQYRPGTDPAYRREQNFQTILQTIGIRANITFLKKPQLINVPGSQLGFNTNDIIHVWHFEFETERDGVFGPEESPIEYLIGDFDGVPYISGLGESMEQNYDVFVTDGDARNIIFNKV
jgi:hypothetical protein